MVRGQPVRQFPIQRRAEARGGQFDVDGISGLFGDAAQRRSDPGPGVDQGHVEIEADGSHGTTVVRPCHAGVGGQRRPATSGGGWPVWLLLYAEDQASRVGTRPNPSVVTRRAVLTAPITVTVMAAIAVKIMVPPSGGMYWNTPSISTSNYQAQANKTERNV